MKITGLETFVVGGRRTNWIVVRVLTDAGFAGIGEASLEHHEPVVVATLSELGERLVGEDPFRTQYLADLLPREAYWRGGPILRSAMSGIDGALHDLKARALGVPVYDLLGGKVRDRIPVYANGWMPGTEDTGEIGDAAKAVRDKGFKGLKFDPFFPSYLQRDAAGRSQSRRIVAAVRKAIGDDMEMMIEAHGRFDVNTAVLIAREIEDLGVTWYEEPVLPDNIDALAAVRRRVRVPVAAGERFYDEGRVAEAIARDAVDVLQPDICHVGGLSGMMKIAALASASMIPVAPHNVNGPVGNAMTLHAVAAMPGASILETYFADAPWRSDVFSESARIIDGEMLIPDGPGLGIDFNAEAAANHPYAPHPMRHYSDVRLRGRSEDAVPWYTIDA